MEDNYQNLPISFEFFPPKTAEGLANLRITAEQLGQYKPQYFSVTYGAGGSEQEKTIDAVLQIKKHTQISTAPHITALAASQEKILSLLKLYLANGIQHLVVLRGDLPPGENSRTGDFAYAYDLVSFIREQTGNNFHIEIAAYPEFHPECLNADQDLKNFRAKVLAGANSAITQYFYNADAYFYFLDACEKLNIHIPVVPGIMPITNYQQLARFSHQCGAEIPRWLKIPLENLQQDTKAIAEFGLEVVTRLCDKLIRGGAPGLHFYTLNKSEPTLKILDALNMKAASKSAEIYL